MDVGKLLNHVNTVLCVWLFFFWRFLFSIFLFLTCLEFRLNSQHVQVYDDIWKLIILYPIDLRIIFSIFLLQPGLPKYSFLAMPLEIVDLCLDRIRKLVDNCTGLEGFLVLMLLAKALVLGLASFSQLRLSTVYGKKSKLGFTSWAFCNFFNKKNVTSLKNNGKSLFR